MYSKFTIPPLVEIRPVITQRVTFRFREIRPTLTPDVIYCNPFRIISRLFLFPQSGGATLATTTPPTPAQIAGIGVVLLAAIIAFPFYCCHLVVSVLMVVCQCSIVPYQKASQLSEQPFETSKPNPNSVNCACSVRSSLTTSTNVLLISNISDADTFPRKK